MRITSGITDSGWHSLSDSGSYEWWYVDALSTDGQTAVVIILFDGMPFSPDYLTAHERGMNPRSLDHASVFSAVYRNGRQICYALNLYGPESFSASSSSLDVTVGKSSLCLDTASGAIHAKVDVPLLFGGANLTGDLMFVGPVCDWTSSESDSQFSTDHSWNPIAPDCTTSGHLEIRAASGDVADTIKLAGRGYVDHNYGKRPVTEGITRWHWGRVHVDDEAFVYYHSEFSDGESTSTLASLAANRNVEVAKGIAFTADDWRRRILCPRFPATMSASGLTQQGRLRINGRLNKVLDWGPFYMRFLTEFDISVAGTTRTAVGISEYLDPAGLRKRWLRPLIKTRIRRY